MRVCVRGHPQHTCKSFFSTPRFTERSRFLTFERMDLAMARSKEWEPSSSKFCQGKDILRET